MTPRIAIVCDWLTSRGGAERVILALHELFPEAPIYTSIYDAERFPELKNVEVYTSFLQKFPGAKHHHPWYIVGMPLAFESFDFRDYDLVISSSHSCAKGIITKPGTLHLSYCHSPPRYLWDNSHEYVEQYPWPNFLKKTIIPPYLHRLRLWDRAAAERVDRYSANSECVEQRIRKYYRRESEVIYPPVDLGDFMPQDRKKGDYFLAVGRLTAYKRFDLLVEAFNELHLPLKIVGVGNSEKSLKKMAHSNIEFLGRVSEEELNQLYLGAKAFLFPQLEDFGITAVEAMAHGCPVIAFEGGGALETVKNKVSGLFFKEQTVASLKEAISKFSELEFKPEKVRKEAERFGTEIFMEKMQAFVGKAWEEFGKL
ncbi:MAG: glycosyltransferase [Candidatus Gracilibacteria bacterium]